MFAVACQALRGQQPWQHHADYVAHTNVDCRLGTEKSCNECIATANQ
jgi:hypothetical protein